MTCPVPAELTEPRIDRVLTQYRESPNLLFLFRTYLNKLVESHLRICDLPESFDLDTALANQLTLLGKRMGFPRTHCVCNADPVFGFECEDSIQLRPLVGFGAPVQLRHFGFCDDGTAGFGEPYAITWGGCEAPESVSRACDQEGTWEHCSSGLSSLTIADDEMYRRFLRVRRLQFLRMFELESLEQAVKTFFGGQAKVLVAGQGRVVIAPGRDLSPYEISLLQIYPRVLPLAPGIEVRFHFGEMRVFGFGEGWGGLCEPLPISAGSRTGKIFGFNCEGDESHAGFCELWLEGAEIAASADSILVTENDDEIVTGILQASADWQCSEGASWMCEIDIQPYDC